jgi:hypothetical protein
LTWEASPPKKWIGWVPAKSYCQNLSLGGFNDWRMPTVSELRTLIRGCPATQKGGSCGITDKCLNQSCERESCKGCSFGGGPGPGGAYWPPELSGELGAYQASHVADSDFLVWTISFGLARIRSTSAGTAGNGGGDYVRCVR